MPWQSRSEPDVISASTLIGEAVIDAQGEELGRIEEIIIDLESGLAPYAIVSLTGVAGRQDQLLAIPWTQLQLNPEQHRFVCSIDPERLQSAPGFDKSHWPQMGEPEWGRQIHRFYGLAPYWEEERGGGRKESEGQGPEH